MRAVVVLLSPQEFDRLVFTITGKCWIGPDLARKDGSRVGSWNMYGSEEDGGKRKDDKRGTV